jgi:hypothetical protein
MHVILDIVCSISLSAVPLKPMITEKIADVHQYIHQKALRASNKIGNNAKKNLTQQKNTFLSYGPDSFNNRHAVHVGAF